MWDLLDFIFNFFSFLDVYPTFEKHYERLKDKNITIFRRFISFLVILFIVLFFLGVLLFIIFLVYELLVNI
jgi:hypothetical protein